MSERPSPAGWTGCAYNVVLTGEVWCELDVGVEAQLGAGDCLPGRCAPRMAKQGNRAMCHGIGDGWGC